MKLSLVLPSTIALALAAVFTGGNTSEGYALIGHNLDLNQRDFRVFNGFTNTASNNNQTPDANFPGAQGAVMAIWKGAIEWGSRLHGDGNGDPTQAGNLGSGGANFDASFQGEANVIGNVGDNICSPITGSSGSVLAYAETTGSGNWRMRFYTSWNWSDGPGNVAFNEEDMQSVATHEYGHCLGLGHSATTSATMYASYPGGTAQRSIATDDANGVKAIYGVAAANKPIISGISSPAIGQLVIAGSNFGASNEVWFTREDFTGNGIPVKLTGVASTGGGTQITVNVPAAVRPGDILVRNSALTGHSALSNAWPFDTDSVQCPGSVQICAGFPNSTGAAGQVFIFGSQSVAANDTVLTAQSLPVGQFAMFLYGQGTTIVPVGNGFLCLMGSQFYRLPIVQVDMFGQASYNLDLTNLPPGGAISVEIGRAHV